MNKTNGTGICDQYLDEATRTAGLRVLMGGGRKWFLPKGTVGSARSASSDYVLPTELSSAWGVKNGAFDETRDLIADFQADGFYYAPDAAALNAIPNNARKLLGLFAFSNMNVAYDKINGRRGTSTLVNDYGFPDQPLLEAPARSQGRQRSTPLRTSCFRRTALDHKGSTG